MGSFETEVEHLAFEDDMAAYLLGALAPEEAAAFAAHAERCPRGQREEATLRPAVELLGVAVPPLPAPAVVRERVLAEVHEDVRRREQAARPARRRRWAGLALPVRPLTAVAATAALLVGGGVLVDEALRSGGETRTVAAQVRAAQAPGASAALEISGDRALLRVRRLPDPPEGRVYQVWLKRPGRAAPEATSVLFSPRGDGSATTAVPSVRDVDAVLVTDEPRRGSRQPTRTPVIIARTS